MREVRWRYGNSGPVDQVSYEEEDQTCSECGGKGFVDTFAKSIEKFQSSESKSLQSKKVSPVEHKDWTRSIFILLWVLVASLGIACIIFVVWHSQAAP